MVGQNLVTINAEPVDGMPPSWPHIGLNPSEWAFFERAGFDMREFFLIRPTPPTQEETTMAFKFDFKQTGTMKDPADIREIVEAAMRGLNRKLKVLGATIKLTATFDGKTKGEG